MDISEVSETIKIKYQLTLVWQDKRLTYLNLKNESSLNMVSHEEASHIWYPIIVFGNTQKLDQSQVRRDI